MISLAQTWSGRSNSRGFFLADPAEDWTYVGGFLVAAKNQATFYDLPGSVTKPATQKARASFYAEDHTHKFSLKVVLTGLDAIIGGNPGGGFGVNSNLILKQIDAEGLRASPLVLQLTLKDPQIEPIVKDWLKDHGTRVYIVGLTLQTKNLSIQSDSSGNLDLSFNGNPASTCPDSSTPSNKDNGSNSNQPAAKPPAGPQKGPGPSASALTASSESEGMQSTAGQSQGASPSSNRPGGELHVCVTKSNKVTLTNDNPLVFAAGGFEVTLKGTELHMSPIMSVPKNDSGFNEYYNYTTGTGLAPAPEFTKPQVKTASELAPNWTRAQWPKQ